MSRLLAGAILMAALAPGAAGQVGLDLSAQWRIAAVLDGEGLGTQAVLEAFDSYGATLADLDGDGVEEYVALNDNARAYVLDVARARVLAEVATWHPGNRTDWHTQSLSGVAAGDLDRDGLPDLLVLNTGGNLVRLEASPRQEPDGPLDLSLAWQQLAHAPRFNDRFWQQHPWLEPVEPERMTHLAHGHPFLAEVEGEAMVFVQSDGLPGQFAFRAGGELAWMEDWEDGHAGPWVGRLRPDQSPLAVFATDSGTVTARHAASGRLAWRYQVPPDEARPGSFSVPPAVLDVDGDGVQELFVAARQATPGPDPDWMERMHARLVLLDADGRPRWSVQHPQGNPMVHSRAVGHDVQGDGVLDLVVLDWNTIGRKPGDWERLGPGNLMALDGRDGRLLWTAPVDAPETDFDLAIVEDGGRALAAVPHARDGEPGVAMVALRDGAHASWQALPRGWTPTRGVVLYDTDADGDAEAVVPVHRQGSGCVAKLDVPCRAGGLAVFETGLPAAGIRESGLGRHSALAAAPAPDLPVQADRPLQAARPVADAAAETQPASGAAGVAAVAAALALLPALRRRP